MLSDIAKVLEQIPIWKTLKALPDRVAALEAEVAALKKAAAEPPAVSGEPCKFCGQRTVRLTSSVKSRGPFGRMGAMDEVWTCGACGKTEERMRTP